MNRWAASSVLALGLACGDDGSSAPAETESSGGPVSTGRVPTSGPATTDGPVTRTTGVGSSSATPTSADSTGPGEGGSSSGSGGQTQGCEGSFPAEWINGTQCGTDPLIEVHHYDEDTVILRQSLCTSFEGPFLYMFFGQDQVLLEDTGDGGVPVADVVYDVIDQWLADHGRDSIELLVVNSHAHGDHVQGNPLFEGQPMTTVVPPNVGALSSYFGIGAWPTEIVQHDLGGRLVDVIPIPGHQSAHIALYDHQTGMLLTGDTLYPGRLYIADFPEYVESIERMVEHADQHEICHVMGTHIEMTDQPGVDFPFGSTMHPQEHRLPLGQEHLVELRDAVVAMNGEPVYEVHDDFIVYPL